MPAFLDHKTYGFSDQVPPSPLPFPLSPLPPPLTPAPASPCIAICLPVSCLAPGSLLTNPYAISSSSSGHSLAARSRRPASLPQSIPLGCG